MSAPTGFLGYLARRALVLEEPAARQTTDAIAELKARDRDVLPLYGSPHWLPAAHVIEAARVALSDTEGAPAEGLGALREAAAAKLRRANRIDVDPDQIIVTNAANHGLWTLFTALLDADDEVLTYSPHYYYQGLVEMAGGVLRFAKTQEEQDWRWDAELLESAISPKTKILIVNTPTNPTGYVATLDDLEAVAEIARRYNLIVISDEAYDHTIYDDKEHLSFAALEDVADRAITVCSMTKSYAMRHWRVGFLALPRPYVATVRKILEWNCFQCNHIAQHAAVAALAGPQDYVREIGRRFERGRDLMLKGLTDAVSISFITPGGGPFLFVNAKEIPGGAEMLWRTLLYDFGVPTDPGGAFGSADHLRLPFGGEETDVVEAAGRIVEATKKLLSSG